MLLLLKQHHQADVIRPVGLMISDHEGVCHCSELHSMHCVALCLKDTSLWQSSFQKGGRLLTGSHTMQFGSHYTLFRQDRTTNIRTEIAKVTPTAHAVAETSH